MEPNDVYCRVHRTEEAGKLQNDVMIQMPHRWLGFAATSTDLVLAPHLRFQTMGVPGNGVDMTMLQMMIGEKI